MRPLIDESATAIDPSRERALRSATFAPPRRRWPGILGAGILGAGIAALAVSSLYDTRSWGTRLDSGVASAQDQMHSQVSALQGAASAAATGTALATEKVADALGDVGITAAVKTALAADPALSALKIEVSTHDGVVRLDGPAPDQKARDRAQVLAAAPQGVISVENRLVVPVASQLN